MKKEVIILLIVPLLLFAFSTTDLPAAKSPGWKAGVASIIITPAESMWMAGFAFRDHPSEGKLLDVWAKALAIEDENGKRAVLVSIEISGLHKLMSDKIRNSLKLKFGLSKEQVLLNSTHTHSGPAISFEFIKDPVEKKKVEKYALKFEAQMVELVGAALKNLQPVTLYSGNGVTRFQVNRRNNIENKLHLLSQFNGPNDFAVPVIKVVKKSGELLAIAFGYACHNSVLKGYKWSGDYAGFAQVELEALYPGATALFFQGTGGDLIAFPRLTEQSAKQHGKSLAAAVERAIDDNMKELSPTLSTTYSEVFLESAVSPSREELLKMVADTVTFSRNLRARAESNLNKLKQGQPIMTSYPYPVQVWKIGSQPVITLGGEPVVEYALQLKRIFGQEAFVFGYSNDVMAYITTPQILNEGGYEGKSAPFSGSVWSAGIEKTIILEVLRLSKLARVPVPDPKRSWVDLGVKY